MDDRSIAATDPHCGVCRHVYFRGDWDRRAYCSEWNHPTTVRVGDVCSAFDPHEAIAVEETDVDADADIDRGERTTGTVAPFYAAYREGSRYGWFCGHCRSLDVVVDTMGRIECTECENDHRPTEWDAAYL